MARIMLLLGGNLGDVEGSIERAVELIAEQAGEVVRCSSLRRSEAWGFQTERPPFTNQAVEICTTLDPEALLCVTQSIEREVGRAREQEQQEKMASGERYASRVIDIDIILYEELIYRSERLTIPHPLMQEREFVLSPIVEIAPEWRNAVLGASCWELLERLTKD